MNAGPLVRTLLSILGLGLLMVVHEGGHYLVARAFGMRVVKFSIGFGPVLWSRKREDSDTTWQIGLLPFLAYVQIAGMNPHEEIEPDDKGSYANASWIGRLLTITAGSAANYVFAVVAFFFLLVVAGRPDIDGTKVGLIEPSGAAASAHVQVGDTVQAVDGKPVGKWSDMRDQIQAHKGIEIALTVLRDGQPVTLKVTPSADAGRVGIGPAEIRRPVTIGEATKEALVQPPKVAYAILAGFGRLITGKEKPDLRGPVGIVQEAQSTLKQGVEPWIELYALLSIYLSVFNLLPWPALDGGRIAFLIYEFVARRRPDAKVEAMVHLVGMVALLMLFVPLMFKEIWQVAAAKLFVKG